MKPFKICTGTFRLNGIHVPTGAAWGEITTKWGKEIVTDKRGIQHIRKNVKESRIYYMVTDFDPIFIKDKYGSIHQHYYIHVYDSMRDAWNHNAKTCDHPKYYQLAELLTQKLEELNIRGNVRDYTIPHKALPNEKRAQVHSRSVFRVNSVGYALSPAWGTDHDTETKPRFYTASDEVLDTKKMQSKPYSTKHIKKRVH